MPVSEQYFSVSKLSKSFGGLNAVMDLDFSVPQGKIVGMIGPNGAGKTTVFNLITGFLRPDQGRVVWRDKNLVGLKPNEIVNRGIARTFQLVKPFPELSLFDNIRVACYGPRFARKKMNARRVREKIQEVAEKVNLPSDLDQAAANLGHGDLRLLDIARSLIIEPDLLLLDEPLSGLSSLETQKIITLITELNQQGLSFLIIEHKLRELMKVADHIVAIDFGVKLAEGPPDQVVNNPEVIEAYLGRAKEKYVAS